MTKHSLPKTAHAPAAVLIALAAALMLPTGAHAQSSTAALGAEANAIDKIFSWATPEAPGCTVAVSRNGQVIVNRAYGAADLERDVRLSPSSTFDAGSLRKQFVAAAILLLVEEGRLALSDDVRKFIPELPDYGNKITLDHMLTHTSGLRDWPALLNMADGDVDAWTMILRQRGLNFAPGEQWSYSNTGYVLLTEIVARTSGMSFAEFTRQRLFEPLGMSATRYVDDMREVIKNRALAYEKEGNRWKQDMLLGNDRGGGGALFTTASDLLIWNDALTSGKLGASVSQKLLEPATLNNGRKLTGSGRGLFMDTYRGSKEFWYSGSAAAYKGWLGRYPEHGLSLAILCNAGDSADRTVFARQIFDVFVPEAPPQPAETGPPPVLTGEGLADANSKAGLFVNEKTGESLRLAVDRSRFRVAAGPGLVRVAEGRFRRWGASVQFMSQDAFELRFLSPDQFELVSMEGTTTRYRRAQPFTPTDADLQAMAGRYDSDELKAVIRLTPGKGGLMGRINDTPGPSVPFSPVDRDTFQLSMLTLRFHRDSTGNVVALDLSNPVLRNIRFTRQSERATGR
jgi:CubicO group peptidase (beta-lactamase class C family)